jgi:ABC-2 type transport system ATP-binding protein
MSLLPLNIENLVKTYDGRIKAVDDVTFTVNPGEIFGLLGPNGAGKTSIISTITTLETPTTGSVRVFGLDVCKDSKQTKKMLGVVHQEIISSGFFDVNEILNFQSGYYGLRKNQERIDFLLHKLALWEHRHKKVKQLSGGMKRRLMIAKALVHQPKLLLLDEPTAGVDISLRETLWQFVSELRRDGMSILLTTHYLEEAENLCDRVGIINRGRLECLGRTHDIVSQFTHRTVLLTLNQPIAMESDLLTEQKDRQYRFVLPQNMTVGDLMHRMNISSAMVEDIRIHEGKLEDAFLSVLSQGAGS